MQTFMSGQGSATEPERQRVDEETERWLKHTKSEDQSVLWCLHTSSARLFLPLADS